MTPLRNRMIRELQLERKSPKTIEACVTAVVQLAVHYRRSPVDISLEEVRDYHRSRNQNCPTARGGAHTE